MNTKIKEHDRDVKQCSNCNTFGAKLVCRNCKAARYCSRECQGHHWKKDHKEICSTTFKKRLLKTKDTATGSKECAHCDSSWAKLVCAKCKATNYCSKACQLSHWRNGHKEVCVTPEQRRPESNPIVEKSPKDSLFSFGSNLCAICHEIISLDQIVRLPCKHRFHTRCVSGLRKYARNQNCPVCRTELPPGPWHAHEDAMQRLTILHRRLERESRDYTALSKDEMVEIEKIFVLVRGAAMEGFADAQLSFGLMLGSDIGSVVKNETEAAKWFVQKAAEQGVPHFFNLLETGNGDVSLTFEASNLGWFEMAAEQGHFEAQTQFNSMILTGEVIPQISYEAVTLLHKAAEQGDAEAQCLLGVELMTSVADHNYYEAEAVMWFRKAAEQGHLEAQFNLSMALMKALGVDKSEVFELEDQLASGDLRRADMHNMT